MKQIIKLAKAAAELTTAVLLVTTLLLAGFKMHDEGEGFLLFGATLALMFLMTNLFSKW
jgi:hypothetical protein